VGQVGPINVDGKSPTQCVRSFTPKIDFKKCSHEIFVILECKRRFVVTDIMGQPVGPYGSGKFSRNVVN
jgi:hypothetical protein